MILKNYLIFKISICVYKEMRIAIEKFDRSEENQEILLKAGLLVYDTFSCI